MTDMENILLFSLPILGLIATGAALTVAHFAFPKRPKIPTQAEASVATPEPPEEVRITVEDLYVVSPLGEVRQVSAVNALRGAAKIIEPVIVSPDGGRIRPLAIFSR